jgi:hypothetical protein
MIGNRRDIGSHFPSQSSYTFPLMRLVEWDLQGFSIRLQFLDTDGSCGTIIAVAEEHRMIRASHVGHLRRPTHERNDSFLDTVVFLEADYSAQHEGNA